MLHIDIAARTEPGSRSHNEDDLRFGSAGALWHAVLADGAGGHEGGATASDLVVRLVALQLQSAFVASAQALNTALCDAHAALSERQQGRRARGRMHATVVALWVDAEQEEAVWSHVGDSRLYMLRRGRVCHVTRDDSVVQQLIDSRTRWVKPRRFRMGTPFCWPPTVGGTRSTMTPSKPASPRRAPPTTGWR
jgi:PPM family protein phosphatase